MWLLILFLGVAFSYFFFEKKRPGSPPGPMIRVPIIGSAIFLGSNLVEGIAKLRKKYGDIFHLSLGSFSMVYVCDLDTLEKIGKMDEFSSRMEIERAPFKDINRWLRETGKSTNGIIGSNGDTWKEQRRFTLRHLKDFGFGKTSMDDLIIDEVKELIHDWRQTIASNEGTFHFDNTFNLSVFNCLWKIVSGKRLDITDKLEQERFRELSEMFASFGATGFIMMIAFNLPTCMAKKIPLLDKIKGFHTRTFQWFREEYEKHKQTCDPGNPRDLIDAFVIERNRAEEEMDVNSSFYGKEGDLNYINTLFDLFIAGSETTSTTLLWSVVFIMNFPEAFERARLEIDEVVGRSRLPSIHDRPNMPYFEALMSEIMRMGNVAPIGVVHSVEKAVQLDEFRLQQDTIVHFCLTEVLSDPKYFPNPEQFKPERFLETDPSGKLTYKPHRALIYFGLGKRECLGKALAKMELFLFLAAIVQNFDFEPAPGVPGINDCTVAITRLPIPFDAKVIARK
uniref:Cytochrome P450 3129A1 n=1 Tax=Paracyclopina nana TaxID=565004 RepID=A0A0F7J009_PARNA|nr:cytochrome P450 3129A1 [Paracyclopina nana]